MKKIYYLTLLLTFFSFGLYAQYNINQNKIWVFGYHSGLSFSTGTPFPITSHIGAIAAQLEGCASVSDTGGVLQFYCSADSIWDRNGNVMPNAFGLMPNPTIPGSYYSGYSSTQGALIVPVIGSTTQYYAFAIQSFEAYTYGDSAGAGRLFYSKVDMTLHGGLGDIVPGEKGILIDSQHSEKMIAIPGNGGDIWVLTHAINSHVFKAYQVTSAGINLTPVISTIAGYTGSRAYAQSVMKCSPDRSKLVLCTQNAGPGLQIANFNATTGVVSGLQTLDGSHKFYGAEFSPDNSKLYVFDEFSQSIDQFNISASTLTGIIASRTTVHSGATIWTDLRLAPNGKIYLVSSDNTHLDYIANPNLSGSACNYSNGFYSIAIFGTFSYTLGNTYVVPLISPIMGSSMICEGSNTTLTNASPGGTWSSSNPGVASINGSGVVSALSAGTTVISYSGTSATATITLTVNPTPSIIGSFNTCVGNTETLSASVSGGNWSSSATSVATVNTLTGFTNCIIAGTSIISYSLPSGCNTSTTLTVNPVPSSIIGLSNICNGTNTSLSNSSPGGIWFSSNPTVATISSAGSIYALSLGISTISYTLATGCATTLLISVSPTPTAITGMGMVCIGSTTTLIDTTTGGTWASGSAAVATINASGVVYGISSGIALISYVLPSGCIATSIITVETTPIVSPIVGNDTICIGYTYPFTNDTASGTWSSNDTSIAHISATGIVSGIAMGTTTISYSISNACGTASTGYIVNVIPTTLCLARVPAIDDNIDKIVVFPNPNNGTFIINAISAKNEAIKIEAINYVGQKVKDFVIQTNSSHEVDLAAPSGVYLLILKTDHSQSAMKIILE